MQREKIPINYIVGIDPGINTGLALYSIKEKKLLECLTIKIHTAFDLISNFTKKYPAFPFVRCEDSRKRKWYGDNSNSKIQGAGAAKIQCTIWEDFLKDIEKKGLIFGYEMVHPLRGGTKLPAKVFGRIYGFKGRTSSHARDAAIIATHYKLLKLPY
jgi:hypothetical protein